MHRHLAPPPTPSNRWPRALLCAFLGAGACSEGEGGATGSSAPLPSGTAHGSGPGSPGSGHTASASAAPAQPAIVHAGAWQGSFEAKRAPVTLDPGVKDRAWSGDDGKVAAGPGKISLVVAADGALSGELEGALGAAALTGWVEGDRLTASFGPTSEQADPAMAGTLVLEAKDGVFSGVLRASSGDAVLVRSASVELKRRP